MFRKSKRRPRRLSGRRILKGFPPIADGRSRALILGTMPGPEALRKKEYYGFRGNHFWRIMGDLFGGAAPSDYRRKKALLKKNRIALWDVIQSCERQGASDGNIRGAVPTDVPALLTRHPRIRTIFFNGQAAERLFRRYHGASEKVSLVRKKCLPSTSPAHTLSYRIKLRHWRAVKKMLLPQIRVSR